MNILLMANNGLLKNGLVALYDPYRDVYGRNILPVGSENFEVMDGSWYTVSGANIIVTPNQPDPFGGNNAIRIQCLGGGTRDDRVVYEVSAPTPHTNVFSIWAKASNGTCLLTNTQQDVKLVQANWTRLTSICYYSFGSYPSFKTDVVGGVFDILVYQPQVNLSTLYSYSPPAGLPQSLTDYTGRGNNAVLGSTSGADTNDPKFNGVALVGDGVDDYAVVPLASAAYRISVVDSGSGYTVIDEVPAYLNLFKTGVSTYLNGKIGPAAYYNRVPTASEIAQAKRYFKRLMAGRGVTVV